MHWLSSLSSKTDRCMAAVEACKRMSERAREYGKQRAAGVVTLNKNSLLLWLPVQQCNCRWNRADWQGQDETQQNITKMADATN